MKKENRKQAQEQRAAQRKKQQQQDQLKKYTLIGLPIVLALILLYLILANPFPTTHEDTHNHETTSTESVSTPSESEAPTSLQTDTALTVENGDTVNIDYVGSVDGVEFEGGNTQGYGADLVIGSHSYIDDFEEQLIGAHPGDTVDVVVTFPENYGVEELNGKEALFVTTVNGIYR